MRWCHEYACGRPEVAVDDNRAVANGEEAVYVSRVVKQDGLTRDRSKSLR